MSESLVVQLLVNNLMIRSDENDIQSRKELPHHGCLMAVVVVVVSVPITTASANEQVSFRMELRGSKETYQLIQAPFPCCCCMTVSQMVESCNNLR